MLVLAHEKMSLAVHSNVSVKYENRLLFASYLYPLMLSQVVNHFGYFALSRFLLKSVTDKVATAISPSNILVESQSLRKEPEFIFHVLVPARFFLIPYVCHLITGKSQIV